MSYTKYHAAWSGSDYLSGAAFNHLETQYDEAKADADIHTHDARYYPKATADTTFFSTSYYTGFDADLLDGLHFSDMLTVVMPAGAILIWSGTDANIPTGWAICNGGSGTPDLRDRFIIGAGGTYSIGDTGGPATWDATITPTGSVTVGDHILTTNEIPSHYHTYTEYYGTKNQSADNDAWQDVTVDIYNRNVTTNTMASGGGAHGHPGSTISITAIDSRPAYHSLYYIMKVA